MYIISISSTWHSAWTHEADAKHQATVLEDKGYKHVSIELEPAISCQNGQYFI